MAWTPIAKPNTSNYTNVNPAGKTQYDQSDIEYDDPLMFYDGINLSEWIDVLKPTGSGQVQILAGMATGLVMPPTYSTNHNVSSNQWTKVSKPT